MQHSSNMSFSVLAMMMMVLCPKAGSLAFTPPGMRRVRWFPIVFLTGNYGLATYPRSLRSGSR